MNAGFSDVHPDWLYPGGALGFAGGQPDYDVGEAEECRVEPSMNDSEYAGETDSFFLKTWFLSGNAPRNHADDTY